MNDDQKSEPIEGEHIERAVPRARTLWQHTNGNQYMVLMITNTHSGRPEYPLTIVYSGLNGNVWSRPYSEWHRSMSEITR